MLRSLTVWRDLLPSQDSQLAPDAFGCEPSEILFVSSNGWDACGAAWFGFAVFWINRANRAPERLSIAPMFTGHTMHDVADLLEARAQRQAADQESG